MMLRIPEETKHTVDVLSLATVLGTLAAWLPPLAALVSIIWGLIRIYETQTVQRWVTRRQAKACNCQPSQEG